MSKPSKLKLWWGVLITKLTNIFVNPVLWLFRRDIDEFWFKWWTGGRERFWSGVRTFFVNTGKAIVYVAKLILAFLRHPLVVATYKFVLAIIGGLILWYLTNWK